MGFTCLSLKSEERICPLPSAVSLLLTPLAITSENAGIKGRDCLAETTMTIGKMAMCLAKTTTMATMVMCDVSGLALNSCERGFRWDSIELNLLCGVVSVTEIRFGLSGFFFFSFWVKNYKSFKSNVTKLLWKKLQFAGKSLTIKPDTYLKRLQNWVVQEEIVP